MKKKYLLFGLLMKSFCSFAQSEQHETVYKKQKLKETTVQAIFSYYIQDGNHSAVTGGKGTEELTVYAPEVTITHKPDTVNTITFNAGVDVITSASTDNIDFVISSASRVDARSHVSLGYSRKLGKSGITAGVNTGLSIESDYTSLPLGVSISHINPDASRELQINFQYYYDDLRWGRIDDDYYKPVGLVYPSELRYKEWFDNYKRNSYNLNFSLFQIVNKRMNIAFTPGLIYQNGLLPTPFHRVYFKEVVLPKVENLPQQRWKIPVGFQVNIFATNSIIIRSYYRFYWDNFGIWSNTLSLEVPVKVSPEWTIAPHVRFYQQTASEYFKPYKEHVKDETFYTSDYDLSAFTSIKTGITLRYAPQASFLKYYFFNEAAVRYAWYKRSDGLSAHMITLLLDLKRSKLK
ncbi:MAG: DUF3570 domain-containing protein [Taibaiella sp.]|jgi:hypothetical protein